MRIQPDKFIDPLNYTEYCELLNEENILQMPEHLQAYTRLNYQRMHRWQKTYQPSQKAVESVSSNRKIKHAFIITEPWCGDAAHCIPAIQKLLLLTNGLLNIVYLLRDRNLELMDLFLTNGKRSIPIVVLTDENFQVIGKWGPRPNKSQIVVNEAREREQNNDKWKEELQMWYNHDKQQQLEEEMIELIHQCNYDSKIC